MNLNILLIMNRSKRTNHSCVFVLTLGFFFAGCSQNESVSLDNKVDSVKASNTLEADIPLKKADDVQVDPESGKTSLLSDSSVDEVILDDQDRERYAGEEFFESEQEFSPEVQDAIDSIEGRSSRPVEDKPLKPEYKELAEVLESQMIDS